VPDVRSVRPDDTRNGREVERNLRTSLAAGHAWLEEHSAELLPDAAAFAYIGVRVAKLSFSKRLGPRHAGGTARLRIPVSSTFKRIAALAVPLFLRYSETPPLASIRFRAGDRRERGQDPTIQIPIDRATINEALAEACQGHLSSASLQWMRQTCHSGFALTHQLFAWLLCAWSRCHEDATRHARRLAPTVFLEAGGVPGYYDLLAQQVAFLALGGWPASRLEPLVQRILSSQDSSDGGWHYFESNELGPAQTWGRVCYNQSPLIGWPIPHEEEDLGAVVNAVHWAHRGHATALSVCALGVFSRAIADPVSARDT
jgi:hypothetical protein